MVGEMGSGGIGPADGEVEAAAGVLGGAEGFARGGAEVDDRQPAMAEGDVVFVPETLGVRPAMSERGALRFDRSTNFGTTVADRSDHSAHGARD